MNCGSCVHNGVCYMQETCNDIADEVALHGCEDFVPKVIRVEGHVAFCGNMLVNGTRVWGSWLYKPETDCWYHRGRSYPASICRMEEDT